MSVVGGVVERDERAMPASEPGGAPPHRAEHGSTTGSHTPPEPVNRVNPCAADHPPHRIRIEPAPEKEIAVSRRMWGTGPRIGSHGPHGLAKAEVGYDDGRVKRAPTLAELEGELDG